MLYLIRNKKFVKNCGKLAQKNVLRDFEQSQITEKFLNFLNLKVDLNEN